MSNSEHPEGSRAPAMHFGSGCACCAPTSLSRRQFLCSSAAVAATAPVLAASVSSPADAQTRRAAQTPGRPILIKNGCVLSLDKAVGDFERADILVRGSKIAEIKPNISAPDAEVIDASKFIVMPGFIDTHRHMWQGVLRNIIPDASLGEYFQIIQRTLGPAFTPDDVYVANHVSALGAIDVGITNILDWSHIQNSPEHTDAAIKGLVDSGVRAVFAYGSPGNGLQQYWDDPRQKFPGDLVRLRKQYFSSDDQLVTLAFAGLSNASDRAIEGWKLAREVGARITVHSGIGPITKDVLQKFGDAGLLKADTTYIHCCTLSDTEWKMIRDTGGTLSIAGYVELIMGHGIPPIQRALDLGMRPSLSIDVETSVPGDMFNQMRTIFSLQKGQIWERQHKGEKDTPPFLKARDVLEFATVEGARANGLDRRIGTLTPGKEADLIMLRTDQFNVMPVNNATAAVVTSMGPGNVDTVMIAGKIKKRGGKLIGIDTDSVARRVNASRDRVVAAAKYPRVKL